MNVHLHEPTNHIFEAYRNSSILVVTSLYEPFGLVIPEAMSCGLPVISYDSPFGPASIISDGIDGFLVQNNNQEMFINRMFRLMHDEPLRLLMGMNAIESSKRFSSDIIMSKWETLFSELCS
jgi:glycosyltransferase involved in cell wall biosynthesis